MICCSVAEETLTRVTELKPSNSRCMQMTPESILGGQFIHLKHSSRYSPDLIGLGSSHVELGRNVRGIAYELQHDARQLVDVFWFSLRTQACQAAGQPLGIKILDNLCLN